MELAAGVQAAGVQAAGVQAAQLQAAGVQAALGQATALPVGDARMGAVAMLWMLYHLDDPMAAIAEAHRVLRPGGLFAACAPSRSNDPELVDASPPTTFDAEEAAPMVAAVFGNVTVEAWDARLTYLADEDAVRRYCRSHLLDPAIAGRVAAPLWLTKRGCLVYAQKDGGRG